jgi:hypothetical protein
VKNWQYIGTILTGVAALITAGVGVYEKLHVLQKEIYKEPIKLKKEYGVVEDKDGWVYLRESPDINSATLAKILNDTNLEIVEKRGNWFKVYTESGRTGYIYKDRLKIFTYEQ